MLALLISSLLITGAMQLFSVSRSAYQSAENLARLEEHATYVLRLLTDDIRRAGFWGKQADGTRITVPAELSIHCRGNDVGLWAAQPHLPVSATDGVFDLPCPPVSQPTPDSDTLTLRYASSLPTSPESGRVQIHSNNEQGHLYANGTPPSLQGRAATHNYHVNAWYVDRTSSDTATSVLRRYSLAANGLMQNQEILVGVEGFQVQLGIDRNADNVVDGFVEPDAANLFPVLAVRVELRLRALQAEPGQTSNTPLISMDPELPAYLPQDNLQRIQISRTVAVRNSSRPILR
jgi:type IV pilus assembly protein PilW